MTESPSLEVRKVRLTTAETAKEIRKTLKVTFKGVKFTVRSDTYAGGSSIRIGWTDGPTTKQVDEIVQRFSGAYFDGMTDMKVYKDDVLVMDESGEVVQYDYGVDYVQTSRDYSKEAIERVADEIERAIGERPDFAQIEWEPVTIVGGAKGGKNRHTIKRVEGSYNGDGWNARIPVHVDQDGAIFALSNGEEYGSTIVHRALGPRDLRKA